ncbi:MAG: hypothetical protein D6820_03550 [Lentisphaerae bacterium]|nr:MAG: hypothetical protein D6820_03550 [Lentisphaerota bacterium]
MKQHFPASILLFFLSLHIILRASTPASASTTLEQAQHTFRQALATEKSDPKLAAKEFQHAAALFRSLVEEHAIHNAKLFCNIANAYYKAGDYPAAILWYRRALILEPYNRKIRENLIAAKIQAHTYHEPKSSPANFIIDLFLFWHTDFPHQTRNILFLLFYILSFLTLTAAIWWKQRRNLLIMAAIVPFVLATMFAASILYDHHRFTTSREVVVMNPGMVLRQGDATSYQAVSSDPIPPGSELSLIQRRNGWVNVRTPDGTEGWLPAASVRLIWPIKP